MNKPEYKIIDNFLKEKDFNRIKNFILQEEFPWNLTQTVTFDDDTDNLPINASYYFVRSFWDDSHFTIKPGSIEFSPILSKLEIKSVMRIKANLYPSTEKIIHHSNHRDYEFEHRGAIFYLNTNDGLTILEDSVEIESIENRLLIFKPHKIHRSTTCTNQKYRLNVNFNFF